MELTPGSVVAGRYRVDRKIGTGGMGQVWAGEHVSVGVRVALKTLLPAAACDPQVVARFRREAHVLGRLRSDRVARVVDFVEDQRVGLVLVMDLVEGEPLGGVLAKRTLGVEEAIDLGVDILTAVSDLHRAKIVHRDLKPDNIILERRRGGGRHRAVIVDFGVSRAEPSLSVDDALTSITNADMAVGTIPYMAPEQILSSRDATLAVDLYAVGAILFRAVAGADVFGDIADADVLKQKLTEPAPPLPLGRVDRVARGLAAIVDRALARRPEDRYASAELMLRDLTELQEVARTNAMDLDAPTEIAPPLISSATLLTGTAPDDDKTTRFASAAPDTLEGGLFVESTQESPVAPAAPESAAPTERDSGPPSGMESASGPSSRTVSDAPTSLMLSPRSFTAPVPSSLGSRPTQVSPEPVHVEPVVPPTPEARLVPPHLVPVPLWVALLGMTIALVAGVALGLGAHRWMEPPAPASSAP